MRFLSIGSINQLELIVTMEDLLCGSRKYPYPHHGGNWKFRRGGGGFKTQEIPEGKGVVALHFCSAWQTCLTPFD